VGFVNADWDHDLDKRRSMIGISHWWVITS
jgi:hypothetical protein